MLELIVDNDVVLKYAEYELLSHLGHFGCPAECTNDMAVLAALRFVGEKRLGRKVSKGIVAPARMDDFHAFLGAVSLLEPSRAELAMAAELEEWSLLNGESLDPGESQIFAAAASRTGKVLTGDKRAIASAEIASASVGWVSDLTNRIACLEQSFTTLASEHGVLMVREHVCLSSSADVALSICFSCSAPSIDADFEPVGLASYIDSVRASAPTLLVAGNFLVLSR